MGSPQPVRPFDDVLRGYLAEVRREMLALHPDSVVLVDEIERLRAAGGKRLRPRLCYLAYVAGGGGAEDPPIVRASASLELLHTFALIHDDLIDGSLTRRGIASTPARMLDEAKSRGVSDPERFANAAAILAGDLAAVLADRLYRSSGFPADLLADTRPIVEAMQLSMAAGQVADVAGSAPPEELAAMKTGSYTFEGPLALGAALARSPKDVRRSLADYARPLGIAFQLRDDLDDADVDEPADTRVKISRHVAAAREALGSSAIEEPVRVELDSIASAVS